jgi:Catalytic LigB subunit of aromatic ring-opening dioxygenase
MAKLVAAFGSSHSVMLTCTLADWQNGFKSYDLNGRYFDKAGNPCSYNDLLRRAPTNAPDLVTDDAIAHRFTETQDAMARMKDAIAGARLDALIICGDDQHELFDERRMPAMAIYYGATIRNAARKPLPPEQWYKRAQMRRLEDDEPRDYPVHGTLALHLIAGLMERGFDVAAMSGLGEDEHEGHAFSFVHRRYLQDGVVPIVPVFVNTFYPPNQPTPARCLAVGEAIRGLIADFPDDLRIGFLASGGLSHFAAEEDLDHSVLDALRNNDRDFLANLDPKRLQSGSSEIRNWIVLAAVAQDLGLSWVSYTPGYRTPALTGTGLAFATWQ